MVRRLVVVEGGDGCAPGGGGGGGGAGTHTRTCEGPRKSGIGIAEGHD